MRPLAIALLMLAVLAPSTAAKEPKAPVRVLWNSTLGDVKAGDSWDARLSLLQGPGGFDPGRAHPAIVVTELSNGAKRRVPMRVDLPPNTFAAKIAFPRAGIYRVAAITFDPRHPRRSAPLGAPVAVAATPHGGAETWPYLLAAALALALLVPRRLSGSAGRRGRSAGCARSAWGRPSASWRSRRPYG
jgi:hypothetical protein